MFGTLLSGKITTDDRLKMFQINEMLMTTFNPLPKNWQRLIFQFIYKVDNLVKSPIVGHCEEQSDEAIS
jgi:hypothetical protein